MIRVFFGVLESYGNSPGEVVGLNGPYGKGEKGLKGWLHAPPWAGPNWIRRGRRTPPSFSPLPPSLLLLLGIGKRRGILLGLGSPSRIPHTWRAPLGLATSSLPSFIYMSRGHPIDTEVDL